MCPALQGRVEIFHDNVWGTVCDDDWDDNDAKVVCRSLGLNTIGAWSSCCASFGQGSGTIWMDDVHCSGTESELSVCPFNGWGTHNCVHGEEYRAALESTHDG